MNIFRKLFGNTEISWKILILYSVATGVVVGLLNCIPLLADTSFAMPAVNLEYWIVAALFVITNSRKASEAMEKTFVFFLISQPLIYLVEVPFKAAGWSLFGYYGRWFILTILTIPGSWIAYQVKRDNMVSALILSVATGFLLFTGISIAKGIPSQFPCGLVAVIFCIAFAVIFIQILLKQKKTRATAYVCSILIAAALMAFTGLNSGDMTAAAILEDSYEWEITETDVEAEIKDNFLTAYSRTEGTYHITVQNNEGETVVYEAIFDQDFTSLNPKEDTGN